MDKNNNTRLRKGVPISPKDIPQAKEEQIPVEVIDAFNELIVKNYDYEHHCASFSVKQVCALAADKLGLEVFTPIFKHNWLDIGPIFEKGWKVKYERYQLRAESSGLFFFEAKK